MSEIDWSKPVRFVDSDFEILSVLSTDIDDGPYPVLLHVKHPNGKRGVWWCSKDGRCPPSGNRVENIPPKRVRWVNVYPDNADEVFIHGVHKTRFDADKIAGARRTHVLEIDIDTGECTRHEVRS